MKNMELLKQISISQIPLAGMTEEGQKELMKFTKGIQNQLGFKEKKKEQSIQEQYSKLKGLLG